jgi:hypothetical protein
MKRWLKEIEIVLSEAAVMTVVAAGFTSWIIILGAIAQK